MSKNVVIIGCTSTIAEATARYFAGDNCRLFIHGRNDERLKTIAGDLEIRGADIAGQMAMDLTDFDQHPDLVKYISQCLVKIDVLLIAHGILPSQKEGQENFHHALESIEVNALATISLLTLFANLLEQQNHGIIAVISSVAGLRGRQSNYIYGASKGMINIFMQGLRNRLTKSGVDVLTILPGFVDTPMTRSKRKSFLWSSAEQVGKGIYESIKPGKMIVYLPWYWKYIMLIIRLIPERIFIRLNL